MCSVVLKCVLCVCSSSLKALLCLGSEVSVWQLSGAGVWAGCWQLSVSQVLSTNIGRLPGRASMSWDTLGIPFLHFCTGTLLMTKGHSWWQAVTPSLTELSALLTGPSMYVYINKYVLIKIWRYKWVYLNNIFINLNRNKRVDIFVLNLSSSFFSFCQLCSDICCFNPGRLF